MLSWANSQLGLVRDTGQAAYFGLRCDRPFGSGGGGVGGKGEIGLGWTVCVANWAWRGIGLSELDCMFRWCLGEGRLGLCL